MTLMGLLVSVISVTGVYIWWRKRRGRVKKANKLDGEVMRQASLKSSLGDGNRLSLLKAPKTR